MMPDQDDTETFKKRLETTETFEIKAWWAVWRHRDAV